MDDTVGNSCDVYLIGEGQVRHRSLGWDRVPLSVEDGVHSAGVMLPAIPRQLQEYLEPPGPTLVIRPG